MHTYPASVMQGDLLLVAGSHGWPSGSKLVNSVHAPERSPIAMMMSQSRFTPVDVPRHAASREASQNGVARF